MQIRNQTDHLEFLDRFAKLDLEYDELVVRPLTISLEMRSLQAALQINPSTIKFLKLAGIPERE